MSGSESVGFHASSGVLSFAAGLGVGIEVLLSASALNLLQALTLFSKGRSSGRVLSGGDVMVWRSSTRLPALLWRR